jgi:hypothetical protein
MSPTAMPPVFVGHRPKSLITVHGSKLNVLGGRLRWIQPGYEVNDMYDRPWGAAVALLEALALCCGWGPPLAHPLSTSGVTAARSAAARRPGHDFGRFCTGPISVRILIDPKSW